MSLKHAALGLLSRGPASGYDLLQTFHGSLVNVWPATQSQLYGELGKLADAGLVEIVSEGARGRKEYALTEAGLAELRHWLTEVEPTTLRRSDMLLRVFFLNVVEREDAEEYLRRRSAQATAYHAELRAIQDRIAGDSGPLSEYGRLTLEWGLRYTAMQHDWADWALEQLAHGAVGDYPPLAIAGGQLDETG
ncbi:MAG TPA: PadR family transcriptional regulator [Pseudonocardiaceae bacterium]|jgi:DNA-binding PadR family transcriptional regulator|nr:PadR family transcriptional regulator [Pseudonocardiaceae bacterium]